MKTITFLCISVFFFSYTLLHGQSKVKKSADVVLQFDFKSKQWDYGSKSLVDEPKKEKPYFALTYKSQPVIKVTNLPDATTMVEIDDENYDVTPEVEIKEKQFQVDGKKSYDTTYSFTQTMAMVDSDEVSYKVTVKNSADTILHTTEAFAKVYRKLKIDLSTGVLFHNLQDKSYFFSDAGNDQSSITKDDSKGKIRPLFPVVMTHMYWQSMGFVSGGASLGLGIDDSGKAGYYLAPSLIFGDRQRAILSFGGALRPTDVLKGKYEVGQTIPTGNLPEVTDLVESTYKLGWFVSITYNLTSKVEKREKP